MTIHEFFFQRCAKKSAPSGAPPTSGSMPSNPEMGASPSLQIGKNHFDLQLPSYDELCNWDTNKMFKMPTKAKNNNFELQINKWAIKFCFCSKIFGYLLLQL